MMRLTSPLKGRSVLMLSAACLALYSGVAQAQSTTDNSAALSSNDTAIEEVTVTGSRIANAGYAAATPVTALTADQLLSGTPSTVTDALIKLPQLSGSATRSYCCAAGAAGNFLNLRQLGANRTLVLLNGHRVAPSTSGGLVDANILPELLLQRVEIVTGGASAAYGSDAVAGVVNYITDQEFEGLKVNVQGGISKYGDDKQFKAGVAGGVSILNGRGHLTGSIEHFQSGGIDTMLDRPLSAKSWVLGGSGTAASPYTPYSNSVFFTGTAGGLIVASPALPLPLMIPGLSSPLTGIGFQPGGVAAPWNPGQPVPGNILARIGGDGYSPAEGMQPLGKLKTDHVYGRFAYDFSQNLKGYVQVNAARVVSQNAYGFSPASSNWGTLPIIYSGNPFLPASIQTRMTNENIPSFAMARSNTDFGGPSYNHSTTNYYEVSGGLKGNLGGDWTWDAYLGYGDTKLHSQERRALNVGNFLAAIDAVKSPAGQTVCRVTLTSPGSLYDGCVPINLFGVGSPSAAAIAYVTGTNKSMTDSAQTVISLDFQGPLFTLPAGDVSLATGVEWRTRELSGTSNAIAASKFDPSTIRGVSTTLCPTPGDPSTCRIGGWIQGNVGPQQSVNDTVKEGYLETIVPLLKDQHLAQSLDLNGAVRYTNYSNSGGVFTWKAGVTYQPVDDIRFRATRSRDIRAPNLYELFASPSTAFQAFITNPFTGNAIPTVATINSGNPNLKPEIGDTTSFGAVLTPTFIQGLTASVDYYRVRLSGGIVPTSAQSILTDCFAGDATRCALITGTPATDAITSIRVLSLNNNVEHRSGIDFDVTYAPPIDNWLGDDSRLTFHLLGNYVNTADQVSGGVTTKYAGTANPLRSVLTLAGVPRWRGQLSATYENGPYSFTVTERYIGSMKNEGNIPNAVFANPRVPSVFYTSLTANYNIETNSGLFQVYGTINNLFNKKPALVPNTLPGVGYPTVPNLYDLDGRYFTLGLRYQM